MHKDTEIKNVKNNETKNKVKHSFIPVNYELFPSLFTCT